MRHLKREERVELIWVCEENIFGESTFVKHVFWHEKLSRLIPCLLLTFCRCLFCAQTELRGSAGRPPGGDTVHGARDQIHSAALHNLHGEYSLLIGHLSTADEYSLLIGHLSPGVYQK